MEKTTLMTNTRELNNEEKCELISALSNAAQNNNRHVAECLKEASSSEDEQIFANLTAEATRYKKWESIDKSLVDAIREGRVVIIIEGDED